MINFDLERFKNFDNDEDTSMCVVCKRQEDYRRLIDYLRDVLCLSVSPSALCHYENPWSSSVEWVAVFYSSSMVYAERSNETETMECDYDFEDLIFEGMKPNYEINITSDELLSFLG